MTAYQLDSIDELAIRASPGRAFLRSAGIILVMGWLAAFIGQACYVPTAPSAHGHEDQVQHAHIVPSGEIVPQSMAKQAWHADAPTSVSASSELFLRAVNFFPINMRTGPVFLWFFPPFAILLIGASLGLMAGIESTMTWHRSTPSIPETLTEPKSPYRTPDTITNQIGGLAIGRLPSAEEYPVIAYLFGGMRHVYDLSHRLRQVMPMPKSDLALSYMLSLPVLRARLQEAGLLCSSKERLLWRVIVGGGGLTLVAIGGARIIRAMVLDRSVELLTYQLVIVSFVFLTEIWRLRTCEPKALAYAAWLWDATRKLRRNIEGNSHVDPRDVALVEAMNAGSKGMSGLSIDDGGSPLDVNDSIAASIGLRDLFDIFTWHNRGDSSGHYTDHSGWSGGSNGGSGGWSDGGGG